MLIPKRYEIIHKEVGMIKSFRNEKKIEKYLEKSWRPYDLSKLEIYSWRNNTELRWRMRLDYYDEGFDVPLKHRRKLGGQI